MRCTATTGTEAITTYVRLNNTTNYLVATAAVSTTAKAFNNGAMSIPVVAGDRIELLCTVPAGMTTLPTVMSFYGSVYIE